MLHVMQSHIVSLTGKLLVSFILRKKFGLLHETLFFRFFKFTACV